MPKKFFLSTPAAAGTVTPPDWCESLLMTPAGTLATLTVQFPKFPVHNQEFSVSSTQIITALTLAAQAGSNHVIIGGITTLAALGKVSYIYDSPNFTWRLS